MNKGIIAIVIIVILALGGWALVGRSNSSNTTNGNTTASTPKSSTSKEPAGTSQSTAAAGAVNIKNMMFTPSQITVQKGGKVTWTNNDAVAHTVIDDLDNVGGPSSGTIEPGASYSFTFNKTGSFQYHCSIHSSMRGTIVVK